MTPDDARHVYEAMRGALRLIVPAEQLDKAALAAAETAIRHAVRIRNEVVADIRGALPAASHDVGVPALLRQALRDGENQ